MNNYILTLIAFWSQHYNVDYNVAVAIAKVESGGSLTKVSDTLDVGLYQLNLRYSDFTKESLFDPVINVSEGIRKLAEAKKRCRHQRNKTWVVCYNYGITGGSRLKFPKQTEYYKRVMRELQ